MKKAIRFRKLAHQSHATFLEDLEIMADIAYADIARKMVVEITALLKKEKLAKSEGPKRGWTGEVPKIEMDFMGQIDGTLDKYMGALRYILLGKLAGKAAEKAAEDVGIINKIIPGVVPSAYLNSIDTHREHFHALFGKDAKPIRKDLMKESLEQIDRRTSKFADESLLRLKNRIEEALEIQMQMINGLNLAQAHKEAHELDEVSKKIVEEFRPSKEEFEEALEEATDSYRKDWNRMVNADAGLASAVATHQAVAEIYGTDDADVKVAFVALRDEKTCKFCRRVSRHSSGEFRLYGLGDFKPAGYNYGKKHDDWALCIPPAHPNCRCNLVYVPAGFAIDRLGNVMPKEKKK